METLKSNLNKKNIYAPISGFVDKEFVQAGEMTGPGTPIISILNTSNVKVVADLPEKFLGTVKRGDLVDIEIPALQKSFKRKVKLLGRSIDPSNRTFKVEIDVNNKDKLLKPNLLAKVKIKNYSNSKALLVTSDLVLKDVAGKQFIFIATKKDTTYVAKQVFVETGESYDNKIEVLSGVEPNDLLVVEGARSLVDGTQLTISSIK